MLQEIADDKLNRTPTVNASIFRTDLDYEAILNKSAAVANKWAKLDQSERNKYTTQVAFMQREGVPDLKDPALIPAKNTFLILKEIKNRMDRPEPLALLPIEPLDFEDAAIELAESLENIAEIRDIYKIRKAATGNRVPIYRSARSIMVY